ncbi:molecular chaperone [Kluyvera intermedia]|uniref:fimbrial biogenesis chaperone n=1 Tax=Kluyvera intermedia TaxID=61648 RepID=UPI001F1B2FFD|nr:molecular chaperone [Kluyvera intermedia]EKU4731962.1 molecular chaperone [Kluyvera ascorbata]MCE9890317.1 molecular chaperone [Kluyvera intermedia]
MKFLALMLVALVCSTAARAGVVIDGTRFIFAADKPSISFTLNNTAAQRYLVLTKVLNDQGKSASQVPFTTTPPLFSLPPGHSNIVRIMRTGGDLPADRESLFWLSVASIPEIEGKPSTNSLQVAIRSRMKVFFRPTGLKGRAEDAYTQLRWEKAGTGLQVSNPTPYYVTLFQLRINGNALSNAGMVAPFATRTVSGCPAAQACALEWQTINDYGRVMPVIKRTL